jgi:hypothetical protein
MDGDMSVESKERSQPGTAIFFTSSLIAVVINIGLLIYLKVINNISSPEIIDKNIALLVYVVAASIGVRHLLRIMVVDKYVSDGKLGDNNPLLYWLIMIGTIIGTVSLTISIAGLTWYLLILIPYLILFLILGFILLYGVRQFSGEDVLDYTLTMFTDVLTCMAVYEIYQVLSGKQSSLDEGFYFIIIICVILIIAETVRIYKEPVMERISITYKLLFGEGA